MKQLEINTEQNTKIIATVGPASCSPEMIKLLIQEGVDVFRLNFSHGTHEDHKKVIDIIQSIKHDYDVHIGVLADLQGPKLRIGKMESDVTLVPGEFITFTSEKMVGNKDMAYMSYESFAEDVKVGEKVLVNDGNIVLKVAETDKKNKVKLEVLYGGPLTSNKGVNLPETNIKLPSLTEKDLRDLEFILAQPINWIALSFVRHAKDVLELKERIAEANHPAKVISKIEKPEAIKHIKSIIKASDAIMVARGDLGVEMPIEQLPAIQKEIISRCIKKAKPVIVATQMMESMIKNPSPTRAEVTDVANAVLDGADAVMLSAETSVGDHPDEVVKAMNRIIFEAEKHYHMKDKRPKPNPASKTFHSDTICLAAPRIADEVDAKAILGLTVSGYTAFKVSSYRPDRKIFIFSDREHMLSTLNLVWGVTCFHYDRFTSTDETIEDLNRILVEKGRVKKGDIVVNTGSMPLHNKGRTNMLKITKID